LLLHDLSKQFYLNVIPPGHYHLVHHPIVVFADVCFDNADDCKLTVTETKRLDRYSVKTGKWNQVGPVTVVTSDPILPSAGGNILKIGKLKTPPNPKCPWRLVIYDEPSLSSIISPLGLQVNFKKVVRKLVISDGVNTFSLTDKFELGWQGAPPEFATHWSYTAGTSNAIPNPPCC